MYIKSKKVIFIAVVLLLLALSRWFFYQKSLPHYQSGEEVKIHGYLSEEPVRKGSLYSFRFGNLLIFTPENNFHYGDNLEIDGKFENSIIYLPKIKIVKKAGAFERFVSGVRENLAGKVNALLPEPEAGLLNGILLGIKSDLNADLTQALKRNGTIHVVVVSGYNITVVGGFFLALSPLIGRRRAVLLSLVGIFIYAAVSGFGFPTLRSVLMAAVAYFGVLSGRVVYPLYSLFLVALVLYFFTPAVILDIGFQLSFLATAGILLFSQRVKKILKVPFLIKEDLAVSLSAQLLVIPVLFYHFGTLSLISPLANALTLWTIPFATLGGFVLLLVSLIYLPFAQALALPVFLLLKLFVFLNEFLSQFFFASVSIGKENLFFVLGYYFILASLLIFFFNKYAAEKI